MQDSLSLYSTPLKIVQIDRLGQILATSSGWNAFCGDKQVSNIAALLPPPELEVLQKTLLSSRTSCDLEFTCGRHFKVDMGYLRNGTAQLHLSPILKVVNAEEVFKLIIQLQEICLSHKVESPHGWERMLGLVCTFLECDAGAIVSTHETLPVAERSFRSTELSSYFAVRLSAQSEILGHLYIDRKLSTAEMQFMFPLWDFLTLQLTQRRSQLELLKEKKRVSGYFNPLSNGQSASDSGVLTTLLKSFGIGFWEWDVTTNTLTWDSTMHQLFEVDPKDFGGRIEDFQARLHPEDRATANESMRESIKTSDFFGADFRIITPRGETRTIRGNGFVQRNAEGHPIKLSGLNYDVTTEARIGRRLDSFEKLINLSPDIIAIADRSQRLTFINPAAKKLGWRTGEPVKNFFPDETARRYWEEVLPKLKDNGVWEGEALFKDINDQSEFPVFERCFLLSDENGRPNEVAAIGVDLREKRRLEQEIERQRVMFVQTSKMSALGEMASGIAHEINNPLAIIAGRIEMMRLLLADEAVDREKLTDFLSSSQGTVERIAAIVSGLRSMARDGSRDPFVRVDVAETLNKTLQFCRTRFLNNGVTFEVDNLSGMYVLGRESQLGQALLNLLNNAFDAAKDNSDLKPVIRITHRLLGERMQLMISDSGKGIPPEIQEKIMDPFFTTKEVGKGTGLGLPISRGIIEAHGGRLSLDPSSPQTTFVIELPLSR